MYYDYNEVLKNVKLKEATAPMVLYWGLLLEAKHFWLIISALVCGQLE